MKFLTISYDDGFSSSMLKLASIYEKFGLRAEINVVATAHEQNNHLPGNMAPDAEWGAPYGSFKLWNELQRRGHMIQPHGLEHANKAAIPFAAAQGKILKCMGIFTRELEGFDPRRTIFAFPYNASTPQLEAWLPGVVRAFRTSGGMLNPLPGPGTVKITTGGSEQAEEMLEAGFAELLVAPQGWLVYNAHGLDGEGWGPLRSTYLEDFLTRVQQHPEIEILPACEVLDRFAKQTGG